MIINRRDILQALSGVSAPIVVAPAVPAFAPGAGRLDAARSGALSVAPTGYRSADVVTASKMLMRWTGPRGERGPAVVRFFDALVRFRDARIRIPPTHRTLALTISTTTMCRPASRSSQASICGRSVASRAPARHLPSAGARRLPTGGTLRPRHRLADWLRHARTVVRRGGRRDRRGRRFSRGSGIDARATLSDAHDPDVVSDARVAEGFVGTSHQLRATPLGRNFVIRDNRPPGCGYGGCIPICPISAKYDATVHVARAGAAGARRIREEVFVRMDASMINHNPDSRCQGAGHVVGAARMGPMPSPRWSMPTCARSIRLESARSTTLPEAARLRPVAPNSRRELRCPSRFPSASRAAARACDPRSPVAPA
jgi:hypothetical protein